MSEYTSDFEATWAIYPKRDGKKTKKGPAFAAWKKLDLTQRRAVFQDVRDRNNAGGWGKYIRDFVTYLNQTGWEDEWSGQKVGNNPDLAMDRGVSLEQLCNEALKLPLCFHQIRGPWTYFGPEPNVLNGLVIDACETCDKKAQRVLAAQAMSGVQDREAFGRGQPVSLPA